MAERNNSLRRQTLDIRFKRAPRCSQCGLRAQARVVETNRNGNQGKLYYCCGRNWCPLFIEWAETESVTWVPSGLAVTPPPVDVMGEDEDEDGVDPFGPNDSRVESSVSKTMESRSAHSIEKIWMFSCLFLALTLAVVVLLK